MIGPMRCIKSEQTLKDEVRLHCGCLLLGYHGCICPHNMQCQYGATNVLKQIIYLGYKQY